MYSKRTTVEGARHVIFHMPVKVQTARYWIPRRKETSRVFVSSRLRIL